MESIYAEIPFWKDSTRKKKEDEEPGMGYRIRVFPSQIDRIAVKYVSFF